MQSYYIFATYIDACVFTNFQNGEFLFNYIDENLSQLKIPKELPFRVSLMSCGRAPLEQQTQDCTAPGSMITDFNIWDASLSDPDLLSWTTCRYASHKNRSIVIFHTSCPELYALTQMVLELVVNRKRFF